MVDDNVYFVNKLKNLLPFNLVLLHQHGKKCIFCLHLILDTEKTMRWRYANLSLADEINFFFSIEKIQFSIRYSVININLAITGLQLASFFLICIIGNTSQQYYNHNKRYQL